MERIYLQLNPLAKANCSDCKRLHDDFFLFVHELTHCSKCTGNSCNNCKLYNNLLRGFRRNKEKHEITHQKSMKIN